MKKNPIQIFLCVLLSILLLFSGAFVALAEEPPVEDPPIEDPIDVSEPVDETQETVARLHICYHKVNPKKPTGHVFLYLENLSDETLMVGVYDLPPNEGVSIGSFGFTRSDGFGIYYNTESYLYANDETPTLCLSDDLTREELAKFSHRLLYSNTWDFIFFNCTAFAFMMWNTAARPFLMPLLFPVFSLLQLKLYGAGELPGMFFPQRDRIYRMRGTGSNARLEIVSDKSIKDE